ncbi:MAG TPA: ELWxxDGT repeat protein [Thermoanaerobaculia bacterium]|nr:ELWxxDGT repeat protein [Thermoanaerobaculia bacterium]
MRLLLRLLLLSTLARTADAAGAHLVADLAPESVRGAIQPGPPAVTIGDDVYFEAVDSTFFGQIWRTNGEPGDLKRLTAVEAGGIRSLAGFDGSLLFVGFEADGVSLRRISPPSEDSEVIARFLDTDTLTPIDGSVVFAADDGVHGWEPWRTDGTPGGTSLLADLVPGAAGSGPFDFAPVDGAFAFFFAATDAGQAALWRTDGTPAGTTRVAGFGAAPSDGFRPSALGVVGGKLVFTTYEGNGRFRLWSSDGSSPGTTAIAEFAGDFVGGVVGLPQWVGPGSNGTSAGGFLYFTANDGVHGDEPWRTDGTASGTTLVADIYPGENGSFGGGFAAIGDSVVFGALDPVLGTEPWIATSGVPGARLVRDIDPGPQGVAYGFTAVGDAVYFTADDGASGAELWRSDGTEHGTFRVADIAPGPTGSHPGFLFAKGGEAFFTADSGNGVELWRTDGSEGGTIVVEDLAGPASSYPAPAADGLGRLYFSTVANENGSPAYGPLWVTQGTSDTTTLVRDFRQVGSTGSFLSLDGGLVFAADDGIHGIEPWRTDGTPEGTAMIADLVTPPDGASFPADSNPGAFTPFRGRIAFLAGANPSGRAQLWETDGTAAGTRLIADLSPKSVSYASPLLLFGSALFFAATDGTGTVLWRSDGTAAGTVPVKGVGPDDIIYRMVPAGGTFYFAVGNTLWRSDGTTPGTLPVFTSDQSIDPNSLQTARGLVFFLADSPPALWRSDGTGPGTFRLADSALEPTAAGTFVFFSRDDGVHGDELWWTDGTAPGTKLVRDIRPGSVGSFPGGFAAVGNEIYFSANDGVHGWEPWRSDGSPDGTVLVDDVLPGTGSSQPSGFLRSGNQVYFSANDGVHGVELWAAPLPAESERRIVVPDSRPSPGVIGKPRP